MDIFGIGPLELLLIAGLGLVLFGPEELVRIARQAGRWYGQLRRMTDEVTGELRRGLQLDEPPPTIVPPRSPVVRPVPPAAPDSEPSPDTPAARRPSAGDHGPPAAPDSQPPPVAVPGEDGEVIKPPY